MLCLRLLLLSYLSNVALCANWHVHFYARYHVWFHGPQVCHTSIHLSERSATAVLDNIQRWSSGRFHATRVAARAAVHITTPEISASRAAAQRKLLEMETLVRDHLAPSGSGRVHMEQMFDRRDGSPPPVCDIEWTEESVDVARADVRGDGGSGGMQV